MISGKLVTLVVMNSVAPHPLDENVWLNWLSTNKKQEEALYARTIKFAIVVSPFVVAAILYLALSR